MRRAMSAKVAALLLAALAVSPHALAAEPASGPPQPLYWGAQIGDQLTGEAAPWDMGAVSAFEQLTRKPMSLISFSSPFAECAGSSCEFIGFPFTPMDNARDHGALPVLNWSSSSTPETGPQSPWQLHSVIDGSLDPFLRAFAEEAREWGHPFFLRFDWEMNGFWFPWSEGVNGNQTDEFVAAWRHVHDVFTSVGADNATWVWCPMVDFTHKLIPLKRVYPGSSYVDWTCLDGFNWGKRQDSAGWQSFNQIFHDTYKRVLGIAPDKPMMVGETASNERGGSKGDWIESTLGVVPSKYRAIRGLVWFDTKDRDTHWPLESSAEASRAFARGIARPAYRPNEFGGIVTNGPIPPPPWP